MSVKRVSVGDFMNWGKLVKTWATGRDYMQDGNKYPLPTTLDEFRAQVETAGCDMDIPSRITKLQMIPGTIDTLVIRLPLGAMIDDTEANLEQLVQILTTSKYPLPKFYNKAWGKRREQVSFKKEDLFCFHAMRIGEYTINNCA